MKFIVIRHGKTTNNYWQEISYEDYIKNRNQDPDLCEEVKEQCEFVGNFLKSNKIRINKFLCSCQRRAIKTLNYISNVYDKSVPKECIPSLHEYKGIFLNDKVYPGMTEKEIKELCPDIKLPENMDLSKGWYDKDHKETEEEFKKG